ncbi:TetR/AcrR family transcriptional regulator [Cryobacterium arcticum]|uniref:TetR family transcriptional regulator n=1 Tax=Cryobacterium arcticum TaxID=670052 RepID=A0A318A0H0_9MICO|nr:TetR/AcrR family transcriptional regulator [Cryobacterium arcticum]PXA71716.1 TetR family transcriptional regulator [Cryobacterium arcticum]
MGRWKPDARGRLTLGALELFAERGYEQTTAAEIAERAGVTERTFFRHFPDKREVLFMGAKHLQDRVVAAITAAPASMPPIDVVGVAMESAAELLEEDRDYARQRWAVIAATPSLRERELLKMASLSAACAEALRARGVAELPAGLAAETGVTIFKLSFERWVSDEPSGTFTECIRDALAQLKGMTAGA